MVREPRPGRISLGRSFQCFAGGDNLAAALHRQGECNNHERERACATLCKCNYYCVQLVCCEAFVKFCAAIVKICAAIVRRWTRWPLSLQHGAGRQKSCTSSECQPLSKCTSCDPYKYKYDTKCSQKYTTNNTTISQVCSSYQTQPHLRLIVKSRTFGEYL